MSKPSDSGSILGRAIGLLAVVVVVFGAFVVWKYVLSDDNETPEPTGTVTATASPAITLSSRPSPTPAVGLFDGTWTGHVTGDVHTYDIEVAIDDDGETLSGEVVYTWAPPRPGVDNCEGYWTQTARHGKHVDVHEVITSGDACIDELDITLDLKPNGAIAFAILYDDTYFPKAILTRQG